MIWMLTIYVKKWTEISIKLEVIEGDESYGRIQFEFILENNGILV